MLIMKKCLFLVLMMAFVSSFAFAAEQEATNTATVSAAADFSHLSLGVKGGVNYIDIFDTPMRRDDNFHPILGAVLEYTFNPIFGLGVEYEFNEYCTAILHNGTDLITPDAFGRSHDASLFGSLNLSNLLKPEREGFWKKTNIYANLGVGAGFFSYDTQSALHPASGTGISPLGYVGLNAEHNLSDSWAIGLEGQYRYYVEKAMGGIYSQADINQAGTVTLGLRYKFGANTKQHVRNVNMSEYNYVPVPVVIVEEPKPEPVVVVKPEPKPEPVVEVKPEPVPEPVVNLSFENIQFKFDSYELTDDSKVILDNLTNTLNAYRGWSALQINGHCDWIGTNGYNMNLSNERVASVKKYIANKGIPESKITSTGFGEEKPIATNETTEGRRLNRRVEFEISK